MKGKKSEGERLLCAMITAIVLLSLFTAGIGIVPVGAEYWPPTRSIEPGSVNPGGVVNVTIYYEVPKDALLLGLTDYVPLDWDVTDMNTNHPTFMTVFNATTGTVLFAWLGMGDGIEITAEYKLHIPLDAELGEYTITGKHKVADETGEECLPLPEGTVVVTSPLALDITSPESRTYASICVRLNFTVEPEGTTLDWIGYSLDGGANVTIAGNTTVFNGLDGAPYDHDIVVYANDTEGNMAASNTVFFTVHPGDVDLDGKVWVGDVNALRAAYGSRPGDGNWNKDADLDCDDHIWVGDVTILRENYGNDYT